MRDLPEELCKTDWMLTDLMPKLHIQVSTLHTHTNINTYIHACMHTYRQTDSQPASQTDRQTDRHIYIYIHMHKDNFKCSTHMYIYGTYSILMDLSKIPNVPTAKRTRGGLRLGVSCWSTEGWLVGAELLV